MGTGTLSLSGRAATGARDDRILPEVRITAALVIVVLLLAVVVLYLYPDLTDTQFAWTIKPNLSAIAIGSGYIMGIYFFLRVLVGRQWHPFQAGFLPITSFTIAMLAATLLHLDRFHQGTLHFWLWTIIYIATPVLVPFLWFRNRATDPGPAAGEARVPAPLRQVALAAGVLLLLGDLALFFFPNLLIAVFPWKITPLLARVFAGWFLFPGVGGMVLGMEPRWSSWRVLLQSALVGLLFFLLALPRALGDLDPASPVSGLFPVGMAGVVLVTIAFYLYMEWTTGRAAPPASGTRSTT